MYPTYFYSPRKFPKVGGGGSGIEKKAFQTTPLGGARLADHI